MLSSIGTLEQRIRRQSGDDCDVCRAMSTSGPKKSSVSLGEGAPALGTLPTDPSDQPDVLGHDGHALGMDGAHVDVLKEANHVRLTRFLQGRTRTGELPHVVTIT